MKKLTLINIITLACLLPSLSLALTLQEGDLLFIQEDCGDYCTAIEQSTQDYSTENITHVGMLIKDKQNHLDKVIEATSQGVVITPLDTFYQKSKSLDQEPHIYVGRLDAQFQSLIPQAVATAKQQLNKPYNSTFTDESTRSFYCSQLIEYSFYEANHQRPVFKKIAMHFDDPTTHKVSDYWRNYFHQLGINPPENQPGSNPYALAHDSAIAWLKPISLAS